MWQIVKSGVFSWETSTCAVLVKGGISLAGNTLSSGREVNIFGVATDAYLIPGTSAVLGNFIEVKPFAEKEKIKIVGYNKSFIDFGIDAISSYGFNKLSKILLL